MKTPFLFQRLSEAPLPEKNSITAHNQNILLFKTFKKTQSSPLHQVKITPIQVMIIACLLNAGSNRPFNFFKSAGQSNNGRPGQNLQNAARIVADEPLGWKR